MIYAFCGFIWGMLLPYMARRFSKFMPATMSYALYRLIKPHKKVSKIKRKSNPRYEKLVHHYLMRSIGWGIITSALSYLIISQFSGFGQTNYILLVWLLLLLTEIDYRMQLLPDIITVPLLLLGFLTSAFISDWATPAESAIGAGFGYFIPVLATLPFVKKFPYALGGGDIKLLSAIGAWVGFEKSMYILILACFIFFLTVFLYSKKRDGAFGPALATSTIIMIFYFF